jgi:hypothetical protein
MKKLLITLLLISPFSFADWGDVYYCQETTSSETTPEGKRTDYKLVKFTFKLDKTKNAMVFGKDGYFQDAVMELRENFSWPIIESWYADSEFDSAYFDDGKFLYSSTVPHLVTSKSADCDKF